MVNNIFPTTDIDECLAETECQEICINIPGSYNCSCREGYGLNSDGYSCSGTVVWELWA